MPYKDKETALAYRLKNRETINAKKREWYRLNKDKANATMRVYRTTHSEELKSKRDASRALNREEYNSRARERIANLPPIVYAWIAPDGKADYVGRGTIDRARMHQYKRKIWWTPEHLLISMTCDSEWHAMEMEGKWGGKLLPRYNKEGYRHNGRNSTGLQCV